MMIPKRSKIATAAEAAHPGGPAALDELNRRLAQATQRNDIVYPDEGGTKSDSEGNLVAPTVLPPVLFRLRMQRPWNGASMKVAKPWRIAAAAGTKEDDELNRRLPQAKQRNDIVYLDEAGTKSRSEGNLVAPAVLPPVLFRPRSPRTQGSWNSVSMTVAKRWTIATAAEAAHPGRPAALDEYHDQIEETLAGKKEDDELNRWLAQAKQRNDIVYHDEAFQ